MLSGEYLAQTAASPGGDHLLPYGAPVPPALGGNVSSTPFERVRRGCFNGDQPGQFATPAAGCHRVDLQPLPDHAPQSGSIGDRIAVAARCSFSIPPASFLSG